MSEKDYNARLDVDRQTTAEERIATFIFDQICQEEPTISGEEAAELSHQILKMVLQEFRPDLLEPVPDEPFCFSGLAGEILDELTPAQRACGVMYGEGYDEGTFVNVSVLMIAEEDVFGNESLKDILVHKDEPFLA